MKKQPTESLSKWLGHVLDAFWEELGKISKLTGITREGIAFSLYRLNSEKGRNWEAALWNSTRSRNDLQKWVTYNAEVAKYSEQGFLELARLLPEWARRDLLEIAKTLPAPHGGKQYALLFREREFVRLRFCELTTGSKPLSKNAAYEKLTGEVRGKFNKKISLHAIRMICDPAERERSRKSARKYGVLGLTQSAE